MGNGFDLSQRDPNNLNEHLQVMWDDVFGEPEGVRSIDFAWNISYKCFDGTRLYVESISCFEDHFTMNILQVWLLLRANSSFCPLHGILCGSEFRLLSLQCE